MHKINRVCLHRINLESMDNFAYPILDLWHIRTVEFWVLCSMNHMKKEVHALKNMYLKAEF